VTRVLAISFQVIGGERYDQGVSSQAYFVIQEPSTDFVGVSIPFLSVLTAINISPATRLAIAMYEMMRIELYERSRNT
jgi:hypothetical protein